MFKSTISSFNLEIKILTVSLFFRIADCDVKEKTLATSSIEQGRPVGRLNQATIDSSCNKLIVEKSLSAKAAIKSIFLEDNSQATAGQYAFDVNFILQALPSQLEPLTPSDLWSVVSNYIVPPAFQKYLLPRVPRLRTKFLA